MQSVTVLAILSVGAYVRHSVVLYLNQCTYRQTLSTNW